MNQFLVIFIHLSCWGLLWLSCYPGLMIESFVFIFWPFYYYPLLLIEVGSLIRLELFLIIVSDLLTNVGMNFYVCHHLYHLLLTLQSLVIGHLLMIIADSKQSIDVILLQINILIGDAVSNRVINQPKLDTFIKWNFLSTNC
jgi:hypothetical protein